MKEILVSGAPATETDAGETGEEDELVGTTVG